MMYHIEQDDIYYKESKHPIQRPSILIDQENWCILRIGDVEDLQPILDSLAQAGLPIVLFQFNTAEFTSSEICTTLNWCMKVSATDKSWLFGNNLSQIHEKIAQLANLGF